LQQNKIKQAGLYFPIGTYCMPEEGVELSPEQKLLTTEEIIHLAKLFVSQGVNKIRLTGGEPTVRSDIVDLVQELGKLKSVGLKSLAMTSNGVALKRKLPALVNGGLDTLNVSLDTLDPHLFQVMTRRNGYQRVVEALDEAIRLDMAAVKINTVVMRGVNDQEVMNFTAYTKDHPVNVRFIEYMPFDGNRWNRDKLVPYQELIQRIESMYGRLDKLSDDRNDTTKVYIKKEKRVICVIRKGFKKNVCYLLALQSTRIPRKDRLYYLNDRSLLWNM
jgi:cyclic pyranopterin phosphate synthase